MTVLTRNPQNPNVLHPNKFQLNFARLPNLQYFCQAVSIPGISLSEIPRNTPFVDTYMPGEKAIYDLLSITFYVDEDLRGWKEIHDWIRAMTFPTNFDEYKQLGKLNTYTLASSTNKPQYTDAHVTLLTSSNNPNILFTFYDLFPVSLSTFIVSSTDSPENTITADVTFRYNYYDIKTID
jgi:hypothetical protein